MSRYNRPCFLQKVTTRVKVKPAIFGLGAHAHKPPREVNGLEKPPAGSRRGGGGGSVPSWRETDRGRGQLLHTGDQQLQSCSSCGRSPAAPWCQHRCWKEAPPPRPPFSPAPHSHWMWTPFKAYTVTRKNEVGRAKHNRKQLSTTEPQLQGPKEAVTPTAKVLSHQLPFLNSPDPTAGVHATLQQMTCRCVLSAHLAASPPPLSKKETKERKK